MFASQLNHCVGSILAALACAIFWTLSSISPAHAQDLCAPGSNPIVCENSKPGTPSSEWDIGRNGDLSIQGYATDMSVNVGGSIGFKVDTDASDYAILIYRMGWYAGDGARLIDTVTPSASLPQQQPECLTDEDTWLLDCGNWALSATWNVPDDAVSGVYIARLRRPDTGGDSHVVFVVRDDTRSSDLLFQTSDTTWQAYNDYGDRSLYRGGPNARAYKVSYNRPMWARGNTPNGRDSFFGSEYAMIRWLERNGYDVTYLSGVDTDRTEPSKLLEHDAFLSVGHDEYWSGKQRANVEAARNAGVNLMFASGNEVYWRHRWEPSIDGSNTDHRTLVTYKETKNAAKIDPSDEWTGTWRDPRFVTPGDGVKPENELTGTFFTVNCCTYSLRVPAEYGNLRFWRDTSIATLAPGTEAVFPMGTLGYEWDEDLDNGYRPPGAFRMSRTTEVVDQRLIDYGLRTAVEEATHHLMMYRADSGALVFGAGTVQWSWGLDDYHDGLEAPVDTDMQQATVNVLADMGVQPQTLENGLVAATASTDTSAPQVTIDTPSSGASVQHGTLTTITGTAADLGGGVVAAVEVSLNGGATWHPAAGRDNWSYTGSALILGTQTVMARASDDSGNLGTIQSIAIEVDCPCTLFGDAQPSRLDSFSTSSPIELGVRFRSDIDGFVTGVRFYKGPTARGTHQGTLWSADGTALATGQFINETESGWQTLSFAQSVAISANTDYIASYFAPSGYSALTDRFTNQQRLSPPLRALESTEDAPNGLYAEGATSRFPSLSFQGTSYWIDPVFVTIAPPDTNPPTVVASSPLSGSSSVPVATPITLEADEALDPASLQLQLSTDDGTLLAGDASYDDDTRTVSFLPSTPLPFTQILTLSASFSDLAGNAMPQPYTFSFETSEADGSVPALFEDSDRPELIAADDAASIELGIKFTVSQDAEITGVRFYKSPENTGTHIGSLWNAEGVLLAQTTFQNESRTGWQQALFDQPVTVISGQTYVASYLAPNGRYSATAGFFSESHSNGLLTAPAASTVGGNGVFVYGDGGFPSFSSQQSNYWISPVYVPLPDTQAPRLISSAPANQSTSVPLDTIIAMQLDEPVDVNTLVVAASLPSGVQLNGQTGFDVESNTVSFTSAEPLPADTQLTVAVSVSDTLGNATESPLSVSFNTVKANGAIAALWDDSAVPDVIDSGDTGSIELGTHFISDEDLEITGVRFYKGPTNTGEHTGSLWDSAGNLLAHTEFASVQGSGWQQATFAERVRIEKDKRYVISYFAPNGGYSFTPGYFNEALENTPLTAPADTPQNGNGVFSYGSSSFPQSSFNKTNYWVSPVYERLPDTTAPFLVATSPVAGASSIARNTPIGIILDEAIDPASLVISVNDADGNSVSGTVALNNEAFSIDFSASSALEWNTTYTVSVLAEDVLGNVMSAPATFTFTTAIADGVIAALWNDSDSPPVKDGGDQDSIEIGTRFFADRALAITGVRFFKSVANTGAHTGSLWSDDGQLLAQAVFNDESVEGWQSAYFETPVNIDAGTAYIVSYLAPNGGYSATSGYFSSALVNGALTAPASSIANGNGVFLYGDGGFPVNSSNQTNYWVTPTYEALPDTRAPALASTYPISGASSVNADISITATFDEPVRADSVDITLSDGENSVQGTVTYDDIANTVTFSPSDTLIPDASYRAEVSAVDLVGNAMPTPEIITFFTSKPAGTIAALWDDGVTPAVFDAQDDQAIELGVRFTADRLLDITGVRFFKSVDNTGIHTGSLWDANGVRLAQATFVNESTTGWQQVNFDEPVRINADEPYTVSYFAPQGHYSASIDYFNEARVAGPITAPSSNAIGGNGVFRYGVGFPNSSAGKTNYWVSPVYQEPDDQNPPQLADTNPAAGSSSVSVGTRISATFDEPVLPASIAFLMHDQNGTDINGTLSIDEQISTLVFEPASELDPSTRYSVQISATDLSGNSNTAPLGFDFLTSLAAGSVNALWDDSVAPEVADSGDNSSVEIGTRFTSDQDLDITGIRFYKSLANTGTHIGSLWNGEGILLAQTTFENESAAGWQQADFDEPVRILAGQRYVVSYLAPEGRYSSSGTYFNEAYSNGPLTALSALSANGNGVYLYGTGGHPTNSFNASNYWVSPVYEIPPTPPATGPGLWDLTAVPATVDSGDTSSVELGVKFTADQPMEIIGVRFYKSSANSGPHVGSLWQADGTLLAQATLNDRSSTGWQEIEFIVPVTISAGQTYVASYLAPNGHYSANPAYFNTPLSSGPLSADSTGGNGVYAYGSGGFPSASFNNTNYWITPIYNLP